VHRSGLHLPRRFRGCGRRQPPALPGPGWYIVLGIISVIAGVVVLFWPFDSIVLLAIVTGVCLVLIGVIQIVQSFQIRKDAKAARQTLDSVSERVAA
jgi:uncharacterized membrane protein HdeD (DUF308 family)